MPRKSTSISHFNYSSKSQLHLSRNAELATIIGLAESSRKKKGLLRGVEERLINVARFEYPLYIYPLHKKALILKPFLNDEKILKFGSTLDTHKFIGEVQRISISRSEYTEFLVENINLFKKYRKINQISLRGLMMNNNLSLFLANAAKKEKVSDNTIRKKILVSSEEEKVKMNLNKFETFWKKAQFDLDNLKLIADVLDVELEKHISKSDIEIHIAEEQADKKIEECTPLIKRSVKKIVREKNKTIKQFENTSRKKLSYLLRIKNKLENELRRRRQQEARFNREKQNKKNKQDKHGEQFWSKELAKCKKEIALLETRFKRCENDIDNLKVQTSNQMDVIKNRYSDKISIERKKIVEIEYRRDVIMKILQKNQMRLEELTDKITNDIAKQIEMKNLEIEKLEDHLITWNIDDKMVILIPFYLTRYSSMKEVRYGVITPLQVNIERNTISTMGRKLVGLDDNLSDSLKPLSKDLSEMVTRDVLIRLSKDVKFASKVDEEAVNINILSEGDFSGMISDGLKELVVKEFLNQNEATKIQGYYC